jgi:chromatin remodeling complex protein RSC6
MSTTASKSASKSTKQTKPTKVVEPAVSVAPAVTAEKSTKKTKKTEATSAPVVAPVATETQSPQTENEVVSQSTETNLTELFAKYNKALQELTSQLATLKGEFRGIEKSVSHKMRAFDKMNARKNKNRGNRAPSGFVKPTMISDELADFLKVQHGTLMARTDVTRKINEYICEKSLKDSVNGRHIHPDALLSKLLKYDESKNAGQQLSYFNLQKYLAPHFIKEQK